MKQDRRKEDETRCQHRSIPLPTLREMRQRMALSQQRLAELAGVSANTVRLLESERRGAYPSTVQKLATALGISTEELVRGAAQSERR